MGANFLKRGEAEKMQTMEYAKKYWAKQTGLVGISNYEVKFLVKQEESGQPLAASVEEIKRVRQSLANKM